jgi:diguanylate cyclase (GGDEF)-like protein
MRRVLTGHWVSTAILALVLVTGVAWEPVAWALVGIGTSACIGVGVLRNKPGHRWPWSLLAAAILVSTVANALDPWINTSGAALLYLCGFISATAALLRFGRSDTNRLSPAGLIDALTVTAVLLLLVWVTTISPMEDGAWTFAKPAAVGYPLGDALLLASAMRLLSAGRRTAPVVLLVAGATAALLADITVSIMGRPPTSGTLSSLVNLGWLLHYACWGAAALYPSMSRLTQTEPTTPRELTLRRIWVVALTALTAPAILFVEAVTGEVRDGLVLALAGSALIALGLARVATTANSQSRSLVFRQRHDTLTGLANRAHLVERLTADQWTAVLLIDLDEFRLVNDAGHSVGDEVLIEVARRLARQFGRNDLVARFDGDEFAILIASPTRDLAALASDLIAALARPVVVADESISVTACAGLAVATAEPMSGQDLLRQAGLAMGAAKAAGRGEWCQYESERHGVLVERMHLREALNRAVNDGAFRLHYQPIVALDTGATVGFEALVRWEHPTRGLIAPSEFIVLAEETGLIDPIGELVLRTAASDALGWSANTYVSVNVSARQFRHPGFAERVEQVLSASGLRPDLLVLELTETVLMREDDHVWAELATLRNIGVRLAIDDFGTGFSSLSYLEQTPIDVIKIDKSFVDSLVNSDRQRTVVEGIVQMASKLGLEVVAEGIETDAARDLLAEMRCPYGQGYLFAVPLSNVDVIRWLSVPPVPRPRAAPTDDVVEMTAAGLPETGAVETPVVDAGAVEAAPDAGAGESHPAVAAPTAGVSPGTMVL